MLHRPSRASFPLAWALVLAAVAQPGRAAGPTGEAPEEGGRRQPDIVLIVADDMGFSDPGCYATARGFDRFYGTIWGVVDYSAPFSLVEGDRPVPAVPAGYYYTDALSEQAARFVSEAGRDAPPLFLYVAYTAPHWPLHA